MTSTLHEAWCSERQADGRVQCTLCPHDCRIADGSRGACAVRYNERGVLYTLVCDRIVASNLEPIEKKPFFHVKPSSLAYSIATGERTFCPACRTVLVGRYGFAVRETRIKNGGCPACGARITGVDMDGVNLRRFVA